MRVRIARQELAEAVGWAAHAVPDRSPTPVLLGLLLRAEGTTLTVSGYGHDVAAGFTAEAEVTGAGSVLVSGRLLAEIARALPEHPVELTADGSELTLSCGSALFALPTLWLASLVRSARARTWRPAQITVLASLLGLIGIPIAIWIGWLLYQAWSISVHVWDFFARISPWIARVFLWIVVVAMVAFAGWVCYRLFKALMHGRRWIGVLAIAVAVATVAGAVGAGWLDGFIHVLSIGLAGLVAGIEWLVALVAPVLAAVFGFVARVVTVVMTVLVIAGVLTGSFGQMGRTVCLPFPAAVKAGTAHGKCADFAAGAGVACSLLLTATVLEPAFNAWFSAIWRTTPVFDHLPAPTGIYGFLIPGSAEEFLRPAFSGFAPMVDVGLLLLLTVAGIPFPTALVAEHLQSPEIDANVATAIYGGWATLVALSFNLMWRWIVHDAKLIHQNLDLAALRANTRRFSLGLLIYPVTIGIAFLSPIWALAVHGFVAVYYVVDQFARGGARLEA
jgi:hypothetical protein